MSAISRTSRAALAVAATAAVALGSVPGAGWAADGPSVEEGRAFWSFQPIADPAPPMPGSAPPDWPANAVDAFTLASLAEAGDAPPAEAGRLALARRLSFDLTGLPPQPGAVDAFLADDSPDAYTRYADRLLASRHFGERWARHWLDVVRFAESTGGGRTMILDHAWRFRDYAIDAFNRDKPFDQFVVEHLAGDLVPAGDAAARREALVGSGFLAMGPTNYELQDKVRLRMDVVDEQIDTTGRAFLGMTLGCARCHDHFFDPIPHADYYALAGIFRSTKTMNHANVSKWIETALPPLTEAERDAEARRDGWEAKRKEIAAAIAQMEKELKPAKAGAAKTELVGIVIDDDRAELTGEWVESTSVPGYVGAHYVHNNHGANTGGQAIFSHTLPEPGEYEVRVSYTPGTNRAAAAQVRVIHAGGEARAAVDQRRAPAVAGFEPIGRFAFDPEKAAQVIISDSAKRTGVVIADSVAFVPVSEIEAERPAGRSEKPKPGKPDAVKKAALADLKERLKEHDQAKPAPTAVAMSVEDEPKIENSQINLGGDPHRLGDEVPRGFLAVTMRPDAPRPAIAPDSSGRLELARWVASPDNPLTARVFANRAWGWLTGEGIVGSPDNFGTTGEAPSDPALLDHLASEFIGSGWSVKALVRRIVLSRAYRAAPAEGAPARRLDAEALRDAMLCASGELDLTITGGPTIKPGTNSEFGYKFEKLGRSVFVPVFRNQLPELYAVFDFPDPSLSTGERAKSTLPTQALYLMNHPWVVARAQAAAGRWMAEPDPAAGIARAYRETLGRPPDDAERAMAAEFLGSAPDAKRWAAFQQALFASLSFRFLE